jgi:hypothetical protein
LAARSRDEAAIIEPLNDKDVATLGEEDESTAEELHGLARREKDDFLIDEYLKRRSID